MVDLTSISGLTFTVGKSELVGERKDDHFKPRFFRLFTKPKVYNYYACVDFDGEERSFGAPSPEELGRKMFGLARDKNRFETPSLRDRKERVVDGVHFIIYGILLDTDELKDVMRGYCQERQSYYVKQKEEMFKIAENTKKKLKLA